MKLIVLSDTKAIPGFKFEHGLSFLVKVDEKKILLDTGASDVFLRNAEKLGIDLTGVDGLVLSHGHWDHGNGLQHMAGKPLLCHPGCFQGRTRKLGGGSLGLALSREEVEQRYELTVSGVPVQMSEHLWFLGEIPRVNDFEAKTTTYLLEGGEEDFIMDDSGLACVTDQGLVVISGCAHSGICNMIEHAMKVTGISRLAGVTGGFHLSADNYQTQKTIEYLRNLKVGSVYPSHCTQDPALGLFYNAFGNNQVLTGSTIEF
jgi:7,8-dihydropterin-6-yl-methyl-4-(beta-D-ribofuranosyl)aminobenzene 5'-phosphate synthase